MADINISNKKKRLDQMVPSKDQRKKRRKEDPKKIKEKNLKKVQKEEE